MSDASSGHLDLDALAELEEGLTEPQAAAAARAHVDECEDCRALMSRLRTTRALLSALPPEPMPPHVVDRLDAALAREEASPSGTIVPLAGRRRPWNSPAIAGGAAAAAVVVLVAAIVAGTLVHRGNKHKTDTSAAAGANSQFGGKTVATKQWSTGTNYTPATLASLVPRLVTGTPPAGATTGGPAGGAVSNGSATTPSTAPAPTPASTTPSYTQDQLRASPAAVLACGKILAGGVVTTPVAVDFANFDGKPAVVFALPAIDHPTFLDVWVVRSACSAANLDLYFQRIPRP